MITNNINILIYVQEVQKVEPQHKVSIQQKVTDIYCHGFNNPINFQIFNTKF